MVVLHKNSLVFIVASNISIQINHPFNITTVFYLKLYGVLFIFATFQNRNGSSISFIKYCYSARIQVLTKRT